MTTEKTALPAHLKLSDMHAQGLYLNDGGLPIIDAAEDGGRVCIVDCINPPRRDAYKHKDPVRDAIAERIVLSWNSFDAMREALAASQTVLDNLSQYLAKHADILPPLSLSSLEVRIEKNAAALALAKGEG